MDIAEQIRKHLPRNPTETVPLIDDYCQCYQGLFSDVRNYEYFKYLGFAEKVFKNDCSNLHHQRVKN